MSPPYDAIVLAGGTARRMGGVDKPALRLAGRTLLDHVLDGCTGARLRVVVGPTRATSHEVCWCREDPPGGGPVAALAAGLRALSDPAGGVAAEADPGAEIVVVLAADMPFVGAAVPDLVAAARDRDGAVLVDATGQDQPLAAAYRRAALLARLSDHGDGRGVALRRLLAGMDLARLADPAGASRDCDTWTDLSAARTGREPHVAR